MMNKIKTCKKSVCLLLLTAVLIGHSTLDASLSLIQIPTTSEHKTSPTASVQPVNSLAQFIQDVTNGNKEAIVGVYSAYTLALPVINQPENQPAWLADEDGIVTNFSLAARAGSIGLLAHYEHSGKAFYQLTPDQSILIVYGDGQTKTYKVKNILYFQAKEPSRASTSFISMDLQNQEYSQEEVFDLVYRHPGRLVLQTCLVGQGSQTWGRMFVIAEPVED